MSLTKLPMPMLAAPKTQGRKMQSILSPSLYGEEKAKKGLFTELPELREKSVVLEPISSPSIALQSDFIPEEILSALTSAANAVSHPSSFTAAKKSQISPHIQKGIRNTNPLWHHPIRRSKFKHLTEQPICLTGAGRDISFLCDVYTMGKKADTPGASASASSLSRTQSKNLQQPAEELDLEESLIPEEFHIIKSKGVLGLEYYEDKYTTLLEDSEKRLRSFPSMKPNGRSEVIQLMKVMESMLKKARVDEENLDTTGPTQMHSLLELLKKEQNIYNIVFHELIRQVSVDCVERGELLAKLRHRYVNLLDRIPRQVRSLHNSMMAQRALDRCLTDELIQFKNAIELLARELYEVREHDLNVSKEAKDIQKQLVSAVQETEQKANLLEEYRELYELQRRRLETHLGYLTEERDMWSSATYKLARKVIEKKKLHHAHNLYLSEKSWTQIIRYFIVCLASQDTSDLAEIQQVTEAWREMMMHFGEELGHAEESSREKIRFLQSRLTNWHKYFQEKVFENESFKNVPYQVVEQILEDFRSGENIIIKELERFAGDMLLTNQETLKTTAEMQKNWTDLGQRMLQAYWNLNEPPSVLDTMNDVNTSVTKLTQQYARRMDGENGVASALMSIVSSLETWAVSLQKTKGWTKQDGGI
ncbi:axonemal dynein light chain domain-containing protein 1 [Rhinatrema bivittatum]|uniref:axonemal dynein light chain domain-containing protein 1 n=1 Tax=Rhinatrema bivittatum TaxID=194408 RepID=UPI0011279B33|nr:axonemal dynein light chain domain-containing protein 1 [Rhinatrema bivittatum]